MDIRVVDDRVADLRATSRHEIDRPGREAGLGHQLDQQGGAMRRVARWLEDDRVARDEGRHHLPARDRDGEIPGGDDPGDPDRLTDAHRPLVGQLARDRVAEHPATLAGHQEGDVDALLDVAAGLGDDLAHLASHCPGQALLVLGHQGAEPVEDLAALRGGCAPPQPAGHLRRADGHGDIRSGSLLEPPDHVARVGRVAALERGTGRRVGPLAGDEMTEGRRLCG